MQVPVENVSSVRETEDYSRSIQWWRYYFDKTLSVHVRRLMRRGFPCGVKEMDSPVHHGADGLFRVPVTCAIIEISCTKCLNGVYEWADCFINQKPFGYLKTKRKINKGNPNEWLALNEAERILLWNGHPGHKQISSFVQSMRGESPLCADST